MTTEIVKLNVPNAPALQVSGEYIILKPFCESVGLEYEPQRKRLERMALEGSATTSIMEAVGADGKNREMVAIHKDDFRVWLLGIDTSRLKNREVAELILTYKREVKQVLKDYYEKGVAINTRLVSFEEQAKVLQLLKGILPDDRLQSRGELLAARAMGDVPQIAPEDKPLYVDTYLKEHGREDINAGGFGFGRKLANEYRKETGEEPPMEPGLVHGRMRDVKAYRERHRFLFDRVLDTYKQ